MLERLKEATQTLREAERDVSQYTSAIRGLVPVLEDEEMRTNYLLSLEELGGKPGFLEAIRSVMRSKKDPLTPKDIRTWITFGKKMDLSGYSNAMASIHTTLRRMKEAGEVEEGVNTNGEKVYRLRPIISSKAVLGG